METLVDSAEVKNGWRGLPNGVHGSAASNRIPLLAFDDLPKHLPR